MRSFFKTFFASLLAIIVFSLLVLLVLVVFVTGLTSTQTPKPRAKTVLVLDLSKHYREQAQADPLAMLNEEGEDETPGIYDIVRLLKKAKTDKNISGLYILAKPNPNGFATCNEIRNAIADFRESGKFVLAHADYITQKAYAIANVADKIYVSPQGFVDWFGLNAELAFIKGTLEKLDIEPQVFYAGKFKSATEPFRTDKMTPENKLQTTVWLNDLYNDLLVKTAEARKMDTASLHQLANEGRIQTPKDAADNKLVDGLKYDDEVRSEMRSLLQLKQNEKLRLMTVGKYMASGGLRRQKKDKIALIYAEGTIVDGKGYDGMIGSEDYREIINKARLDNTVKAIVFRVNSGGGSAIASENIWRELQLAKKEKPVIVSFGDVAASGGYYIACAADSIFAQPNTITGSVGVFGIIPNMEGFFKNKLGITFDGVKTGTYADAGTFTRPMNDNEKAMIQASIDRMYSLFKQRVAEGRKMDTVFVDSIAQGRVWTGNHAKEIGLIDRLGGIEDAISCAARMAKLSDYSVKEFPDPINIFDQLFKKTNPLAYQERIKKEMGEDNYKIYMELRRVKEMIGSVQARLPFEFIIR
jgi:protease IV